MKNRRKRMVQVILLASLVYSSLAASNYPPHFTNRIGVVSIREDKKIGEVVQVLKAADDEGDPITFSLDSVGSRLFNVVPLSDKKTANLTLKTQLNRELQDSYEFNAFVTDDPSNSNRKSEKTFYVTVVDVNDNKPVFTKQPYQKLVPENASLNTLLLTIQATDDDDAANAAIKYRFSNESSSTSIFSIHNLNGEIRLIGPLDYETKSRYVVYVVAEDTGKPQQSSKTSVIIEVEDISDMPPIFEKSVYIKTIDENLPKGTELVKVAARDGDQGVNNAIKYKITQGNSGGSFAIDASTGVITVNGTLDAEKTTSYTLVVMASEVPDPSSNTTIQVLVTVLDKNDNPPVLSLHSYHFSILEDQAVPGRIITNQLTVADADISPINRKFQYSLTGSDSKKFIIDPNTGILKFNSSLDYESKINYTFTIVVTETGTAEKYSDNATTVVTLINVNDNVPTFKKHYYNYTFNEEIPVGQSIAVITATDGDLGAFGSVSYDLKGDDTQYFKVDAKTGNITAARVLDYETKQKYDFRLHAKDDGGFDSKEGITTIQVVLNDVNDNSPVFTAGSYSREILENLPAGTLVLDLTATDKDSGNYGSVSYAIEGGNVGNVFTINETGMVSTLKPLDREAVQSYELTIKAFDHGSPNRSSSVKLTVIVLDENDNTPQIVLGPNIYLNVSESSGGGTVLLDFIQVKDIDQGKNKELMFSMTGDDGRFSLNAQTGKLQISPNGIDREERSSYDLVINVTDKGSPPNMNSTTVHITILDVNDNAPEFVPKESESPKSYIVSINEGPQTVNSTIITVNATDKDYGTNAQIRYYVTGGDENNFFALNPDTGVLTAVKELDRENNKMLKDSSGNGRFSLDIQASDQAEPTNQRKTASVKVTIYVNDVNDNVPKFGQSRYVERVSEATLSGTNIVQIQAVDEDWGQKGKVSYNITHGDHQGTFEITPNGYIAVKKTLDAEKVSEYNLTVTASDHGNPPLTSQTLVIISIDDINDNDPSFNQSKYTAEVRENVPQGTTVVTVFANDKDKGPNGEVTYSISNGNKNDAFKINNVTGVISTHAQIDREEITVYTLTVQAQDMGLPSSRKDFAEVEITVLDTNDNSPLFLDVQYTADILENSPVGSSLQMKTPIRVKDKDAGKNAIVTFSLSGPGSENFLINASTATMTTNTSLDREKNASYTLVVVATDSGGLKATVPLVVTVLDVNDEPPRFSSNIYYANVSEDASRGTVIRKVTATDGDVGFNKLIFYSSTGADAKFYIDRNKGEIIVDSNLDREFKSLYILNISASNIVAENVGHAQVYITVTDVIDDKPFFNTSSITADLLENSTVGTFVTKVIALDHDIGDTLKYRIAAGDKYSQFTMNNVTGVITTLQPLDRENTTQYKLTVEAKDSIGLSASVDVIIRVRDVNDNDPVFQPSDGLVVPYLEQSAKGTRVATLKATDPDDGINAEIRFSIVENVTDFVEINPLSGLITQGEKQLDRELNDFFNFTVKATDQGVPPRFSVTQVAIRLIDVNDNSPKFSNETFYATVYENQPIGTAVTTITGTDKDLGSNADLVYGLRGSFEFQIDKTTGNITTREVLNRERQSVYNLQIRAADKAVLSRESSATLIVNVLDVNDHAPIFSEDNYKYDVSENVAIGYQVGVVSANDKDIGVNARVSYNIVSGNQKNAFAVNETTGRLTTASKLDRETNDTFNLVLMAMDHGIPSKNSTTTVTIRVNDYNDNPPRFTQTMYNATLKENVKTGTKVTTVSASDSDIGQNGQFVFKIESGDKDNIFILNEQTGVITLKGKLDHETSQSYTLNVSAKDSGVPPLRGYTTVNVKVLDVDDNAPDFTQNEYKRNIYENTTVWSLVAQVNATDPDSAQAHSDILYRIEGGNVGNMFYIGERNGSVGLLCGDGPCLDRETKDEFVLTIAAISVVNKTEQKSTAKLILNILDINDEAPVFIDTPYIKVIPEDIGDEISGIDNTVLTINARDRDIGVNAEIGYSILSGNEKGYFSLNNVTGKLIKIKLLDREETSYFRLVVKATDKGIPQLSSTVNVSLTIKDQNDNKPQFTKVGQEDYRVMENITVGTLITIFNATDQDEGNNAAIEFSIISGNTDEAFTLEKTNGTLKTAKQLDHETTPLYTLIIQVEDKGNPALSKQKTVKIIVTDLNDNSPTFGKNTVSFTVPENVQPGALVGIVTANDFDKTDNVYYYFNDGINENFALEDKTGKITTKKSMDRETKGTYVLEIRASNQQLDPTTLKPKARRRRSASNSTSVPSNLQRITIIIGDKNDNGPKFKNKLYTGGVSDSIKHGAKALLVTANDADSGNNSRLAYSIDSTRFSVEKETGWILAASSFAGETGKEYTFTITAKDNFGAEPYFNDSTTVTIYILVDKQRAVLISGRTPEEVRLNKDQFKRILENITGYTINIDDINYYQNDNGEYDKTRTGVLFHAVDPKTDKIIDRDVLIRKIDENYSKQSKFFQDWEIRGVKEYVPPEKKSTFDLKLALAIGFGILAIFLVCIFCFVVVLLRKRQKRRLRAAQAQSYGGSSHMSRRSSMSTLPNTNLHNTEGSNPIWIDPYHNWGMDQDDESNQMRTFKSNNGSISNGGSSYNDFKMQPHSTNPLFESKESYLNLDFDNNESADVDLSTFGRSTLGRKGSGNRTPSPEPYESSPTSERNFYDNVDDKYKVTSI